MNIAIFSIFRPSVDRFGWVTALALLAFHPVCVLAAEEKSKSSAHLIASSEPGWPQFRGLRRDGICDERGLLPSWPEGGPRLLWSITNVGRGFSSPIIARNQLYITGDSDGELRLSSFDLKGNLLWQATNGASSNHDYPGARASVTFNDGRLYHENSHGRVACFDARSGKEIWVVDSLRQFRGKNITWGLSECLLVDDQSVFVTAGGEDALLVALDKKTGATRWKSKPLFDSEGTGALESASYVSPILVQFGKRRLLIGCSLKHLFCADADTGNLQWTRRMPTQYSVLAMMPTLVGDSIFMTAPHGKGGRLFQLLLPKNVNDPVGVEEVWTTRLDTCQGGVVYVDDKLFGSFYPGRKGWGAVDAKTGELLYQAEDFVKGAVIFADNRLYALCEDGWMLLLQPGTTQFEVKGRFRLAEAEKRDVWAHPVIYQGRLYLRYHENLFCYEISAKSQ